LASQQASLLAEKPFISYDAVDGEQHAIIQWQRGGW